jgi:Ion channel
VTGPARQRLALAQPQWLGQGALRLALLCVFIVAVGMVRVRLSPHGAALVVAVGAACVVAALVLFAAGTRRILARLHLLERPQRLADGILLEVRRVGLPLLGLGFFLAWTLVYVALWAIHPHDAFRGLGPDPRFADFFYYAVSTAFVSPPGDIVAHSRGARSATMIEMLTGFALLATYLASFSEVVRRERAEPGAL